MESRDKDLIAALEKCGFTVTPDGQILGRLTDASMYRAMVYGDAHRAGWNSCKQAIKEAIDRM